MAALATSSKKGKGFIILCVLTFIVVYLGNMHATPLVNFFESATPLYFEFSIIKTFIKVYAALLIFYIIFRAYEIRYSKGDDMDVEILEFLEQLLKNLKTIFGGLLIIQFIYYLYCGHLVVQEQPDANLWHYLLSEAFLLYRAASEWLQHHISIVINLNKICIYEYCLDDYPIVVSILAVIATSIVFKMLRYKIVRIGLELIYRAVISCLVGFIKVFTSIVKLVIPAHKKATSTLNDSIKPLTQQLLERSLGVVWEELKLIVPWMQKLDTFLSVPQQT
ncbi:MAG: hypothetical protein AAF738_06740 [Bacteroidota bacterium]